MSVETRTIPDAPLSIRTVVRLLVLDEAGNFLAVRRGRSTFHQTGLWELPGGKTWDKPLPKENHDPRFLAAHAIRENLEEAGAALRVVSPFYPYQSYMMRDGKYDGLTYLGVVARAELVVPDPLIRLRPDYDETTAVRWFPLGEASQPHFRPDTPLALAAMSGEIERLAA